MILVTGASGFVGQHLVRSLSARGESVRALYNSSEPDNELMSLPHITWMKCDLLDVFEVEEALQGITDVYHCAAVVSFLPRDKERILHVNVESTINIVNEALLQNVRKLVFLSSVAALGRTEQTKEITEEEEWEESKFNSTYALSKYLSELEVWRGIGEGLNAVILNPGIILGEGDWEAGSARLMKVVYNEFPFYTQGVNGWVDVKDLVKAMYELMHSDIEAERFILTSGNYSYREVFTLMATALGKKPPHIKATPFMTGLVWRLNSLKNNLFNTNITVTKETARSAQKQSYYNNTKLPRFLTGFSYTPLAETIERIAIVFLKQQNIKK